MEEQEEEGFSVPKSTNERNSVSPVKLDNIEDSGFSSIVGSVEESAASSNEFEKPASMVVDEQPNSFSFMAHINEEKRRKLEEEREKKRLAEEEYNREVSERRYKRLMHLLDKSQFYANLIVKKNDVSTKTPSTSTKTSKKKPAKKTPPKKLATKHKSVSPKENCPPAKRPRRNVRPREEHDFKDFVTSSMTSRLRDRNNLKKLDLQEDEEEEDITEPTPDLTPEDEISVNAKYFVGKLRDYQIEGLKWLKVLHENGLNGILADEMGLGKTIQVIALFCDLIQNHQSGPFLIVAPLSTIPNWLLEFERFAPSLPVVLFHGPADERLAAQQKIKQKYLIENGYKTQPIVLTTYEVPLWEKSFLNTQKWRYIVIDEGHRIKNYKCQLAKVLKTLKSMNRLLLTGTPLQNNLAELWSLLNFLLPEIFDDLAVFESWFDVKELQDEEGTMKFLQQEEEKNVVASLREILKPFMLRRVKTDVCLEIPPKKEIIVYAPLTELQRDLYKAVLNRDLQILCKIEDDPLIVDIDGVRPKRKCVLNKSCDAIYSNASKASTGKTLQNLESSSDTTSFASNESITWKLNSQEIKMSSTSKAKFSKKESSKAISSESVRKDKKFSSPKNLKNTLNEKMFRKNFLADNTSLLSKESDEDFDDKDENVYSADDHQDVSMWKQYTNVNDRNQEFFIHLTFGSRLPMYKKIVNHPYMMHCPLDSSGLPKIDNDLITASGKLMVLDQMLPKLKERGHKILLFSTWTKILDILEDYLSLRSYLYVRLDGSTKIEKRKENINIFNNDPNVFLFLISTRAGGVGLNLAGADTVILYDSDWNPQADIQAMARCHRIGQKKPVMIYRFCTKGTIDEEIMKRADVKRKLEKMVISKKDLRYNLNNKENLLKLREILRSSDCQVVSSEKDVFTEGELMNLLDRSDLMKKPDSQTKSLLRTSKLENSQER